MTAFGLLYVVSEFLYEFVLTLVLRGVLVIYFPVGVVVGLLFSDHRGAELFLGGYPDKVSRAKSVFAFYVL